MRLTIDRFEGEYAVCESDQHNMVSICRSLLPVDAKEGSCLLYEQERYSIDIKEEKIRRIRIKRKMDSLWE